MRLIESRSHIYKKSWRTSFTIQIKRNHQLFSAQKLRMRGRVASLVHSISLICLLLGLKLKKQSLWRSKKTVSKQIFLSLIILTAVDLALLENLTKMTHSRLKWLGRPKTNTTQMITRWTQMTPLGLWRRHMLRGIVIGLEERTALPTSWELKSKPPSCKN